MKVLLSLSVLCITLALCQAACFRAELKPKLINGTFAFPKGCIDPYDGSLHPHGSWWNTKHCMRCECSGDMECCTRYGGVMIPPQGCKAVVNPETCKYELYYTDNPLEPCP